jgi:beta-aspartyl-peptidase (threonine type)
MNTVNTAFAQENPEPLKWAIALHGGAGSSPANYSDESNRRRQEALAAHLETGKRILADGGTSLDAVEAVVRAMEDDPMFNAGKGAVFNAAGGHELDASIMDGRDRSAGAVAGVTRIRNPISLARLVMTETPHVLLAGPGADQFGEAQGVEIVENSWFDTPEGRQRWEEAQRRRQQRREQNQGDDKDLAEEDMLLDTGSLFGTVGCVALDSQGNLAAATSTGGMTNKQFGRVGDSPLIGAGNWADNETCAVSCTGTGEQFIRHVVAYDVSARMRYENAPLEQAVREILENELNPNDGGLIAVDRDGNVVMAFNSRGMARAMADSSGKTEVLWLEPESGSDGEKR